MLVSSLFLILAAPPLEGPVSYFEDRCSRCHGSMGSMYDLALLKSRSKERLADDIKRMADGPAQAPLGKAGIEQQVILHQAIASTKPYIFAFKPKGTKYSGEVTLGASVKLFSKAGSIAAKVKGFTWTADLPKGVALTKVVATKGKAATTLVIKK